MPIDLRDLHALAAGYSGAALHAAIAAALGGQFPQDQERRAMASLVAAWLRTPEGAPPPLSADAVEAIYRKLAGRAH